MLIKVVKSRIIDRSAKKQNSNHAKRGKMQRKCEKLQVFAVFFGSSHFFTTFVADIVRAYGLARE
jgi:hypothetical protein